MIFTGLPANLTCNAVTSKSVISETGTAWWTKLRHSSTAVPPSPVIPSVRSKTGEVSHLGYIYRLRVGWGSAEDRASSREFRPQARRGVIPRLVLLGCAEIFMHKRVTVFRSARAQAAPVGMVRTDVSSRWIRPTRGQRYPEKKMGRMWGDNQVVIYNPADHYHCSAPLC
jgi:hypothetical protein